MRLSYEKLLEKALKNVKISIERKRFEIPKAVVEKSGQRTVIRNFSEISKIFRRKEEHIEKFLLKELATNGTRKNGSLILQGNLPKEIIQRKIEEYAKIYVICKECKQADTKLVKEGRVYFLQCEACGARNPTK